MSQINSECLFFDDTDDETEANSLLSGFLIDAVLVIQASTPAIQKYQRSHMVRDRYVAHDRPSKCTSAIRQLAYAAIPDSLDEYLQIIEKTSLDCLMHFCNGVIELYGEDYLRRPTQIDVEKLYVFHEKKHGFPGMIGIIDCTKWPRAQCPQAYRAQFSRGDSGSEPFILLEAVASQDL
ncbi:hypothetical protein Tco_0610105 [Tanacetum coccineum]